MGSCWNGEDLKKLGEQHGWLDKGPGGNHPILMKKAGHRTVPIRGKNMYTLYLPYETSFDEDNRTYCCTGLDRRGKVFGAGSGETLALAAGRLRECVLESLLADASDGNDFTFDLLRLPRGGDFVQFSPQDLLPIRIRLARALRRLKQAEVAERMGITQQAYARLERAGANPTVGMIARLESALQQEILQLA